MVHGKGWSPAVAAAVAALLVCTAAVTAADADASSEYRCIHDELQEVVDTEAASVRAPGLERATDANLAASATYEPIRIKAFTPDLEDTSRYCTAVGQVRPNYKGSNATCKSSDILTPAKKMALIDVIIAGAVTLHSERLNVKRLTWKLKTPVMSGSICGQFTIPESHRTEGVSDTDFLLYVAASPEVGATAWAIACATSSGRPTIGMSNFSPSYITTGYQQVRVMVHELAHALGFSYGKFQNAGMHTTVSPLRGKPGKYSVLKSKNVVATARAHFGCPTMTFLELESEGNSGSHWKGRMMRNDIMGGGGGYGYYTAMTMGALEDLGYYTANYEKAEVMPWGLNVGCGLVEEKCVKAGVSQIPSMFCAQKTAKPVCITNRYAVGYCNVKTYTSNLSSYYQYFSNPKMGGGEGPIYDYCPSVTAFGSSSCADASLTDKPGSVIGADSRCFDTTNAEVSLTTTSTSSIMALCADVKCGNCTYTVRVKGAKTYKTCTPGTTLFLPSLSSDFKSGFLICPLFAEVCRDYVNPSSTRGPFSPTCQVTRFDMSGLPLITTTVPLTTLPPIGFADLSVRFEITFTRVLTATLVLLCLFPWS